MTGAGVRAVDDAVHRELLTGSPGDLPGPDHIGALVRNLEREIANVMRKVACTVAGGRKSKTVVNVKKLVEYLGPPRFEYGELEATDLHLDRAVIDLVVERILAPLGRRVDPLNPVADGRLADGSRVHVIVPPLAVDGPCLTIRRFGALAVPLSDLATPPVEHLLRWAVRSRANVLVVGATGSGKTTLLNALAAGRCRPASWSATPCACGRTAW